MNASMVRHLRYARRRMLAREVRHVKTIVALLALAAGSAFASRPDTLAHLMDVPAPVLLLVAGVLAVTLVCGAQRYIHQRFSERDFIQHNTVGGFIIAVVGSLYAVLLGFLTVVAWQHFTEARGLVAQESAAASDTWHVAVGLPSAKRSQVRRDLLNYAGVMVRDEWPRMRVGGFDKNADLLVMDAMGVAGSFAPANMGQSNAQNATVQQLATLHDFRQRRLSENASGISGFEWLVLVVGALCVISFCWLFGLQNAPVHLMMTSTVTVLITAAMVLLFELQYPFRSNLAIGADDWVSVIQHIYVMQEGMQSGMRM